MERYLTKSLFNLAHECPTKLFYVGKEEYPSTKSEDTFLNSLAEGGFQVGALARCYCPEGILIETLDKEQALRETESQLRKKNVIIFEAAISNKDFFIRVDILRKKGKRIDLIEVKSKSLLSDVLSFSSITPSSRALTMIG